MVKCLLQGQGPKCGPPSPMQKLGVEVHTEDLWSSLASQSTKEDNLPVPREIPTHGNKPKGKEEDT